MESLETSHELAIRTSVAVLTGSAGLLGPEAGAAATALAPAMEAVLSRVAGRLNQRRYRHAAETLRDAADASSEPIEELVERGRYPMSGVRSYPRPAWLPSRNRDFFRTLSGL